MPISPSSLSLVACVGGGCAGIPLLLQWQGHSNTSTPSAQVIVQSSTPDSSTSSPEIPPLTTTPASTP
ncbi:hypothetical protein OVS_03235 [Mycoplasma ovis str. Michigan]|uniref:Uncharacterized protein n=1 Tax=Mycoplasma ovis str. Michigan TaxID=1415773 RepID=A0ABM5P254_9MOLU|nr:hypothetical protein [Mycoplasma ovis]AHC40400.1 hypothetical protein OVS_03235 [Mycoplasma ovis str. Michigan]